MFVDTNFSLKCVVAFMSINLNNNFCLKFFFPATHSNLCFGSNVTLLQFKANWNIFRLKVWNLYFLRVLLTLLLISFGSNISSGNRITMNHNVLLVYTLLFVKLSLQLTTSNRVESFWTKRKKYENWKSKEACQLCCSYINDTQRKGKKES